MNKDNTIFDKETEAVKKAIEALQEMHRAALYDGAKAAQKPIEEELAEKEDEGIELAKLYEEQKPIAEAKVRLLRNASDEAIVRGDPAEAADFLRKLRASFKTLLTSTTERNVIMQFLSSLRTGFGRRQEAFTGTSILVLGNL